MADVAEYTFKHQELLTALVRHQNLHEGFWQLTVRFGFAAANVGPNADALNPAGIIQFDSIGIRQVDGKNDNLTVDAAVANPA